MRKKYRTISANRVFIVTVLLLTLNTQLIPCKAEQPKKLGPQCAQHCIHFCCLLLGVPLTLDKICEILPPKQQGESLAEMYQALKQIGFEAQGLETTFENVKKGPFPVIAHLKMPSTGHFCVLEAVDNNNVMLLDGDGYRKIWHVKDFKDKWTGYILTVTKPSGGAPLPAFIPQTKNSPRLEFDTLFLDCGEVSLEQQDRITFDFPFHNRGIRQLKILDVKSSCRCVVSNYPKHNISPGEKGTISLVYHLADTRGPFGRPIHVLSNDPAFPVIELRVAGNTAEKLQITPQYVDFGKIAGSCSATTNCFLRYRGDAPFEVTGLETDVEGLKVHFEPVTREAIMHLYPGITLNNIDKINLNNYVILKLSYVPLQKSPQEIRGKIKISTNLPGKAVAEIRVHIDVVAPVIASPEILFLGEVTGGQKIHKLVHISSRDRGIFRIESVDVKNTGLTCKYDTNAGSKICLEFSGESPDAERLAGKTIDVITTSSKSNETFTIGIPVYAYSKR